MGQTKIAPVAQKYNLSELLNRRADLQTVTATVHDLVAISFVTHPVAWRTVHEERRRGKFLIDTFAMLRKDRGFSQSRTLESLPHALKAFLNGETWEPPQEQRLYRTGS